MCGVPKKETNVPETSLDLACKRYHRFPDARIQLCLCMYKYMCVSEGERVGVSSQYVEINLSFCLSFCLSVALSV